MQDEAARRLNGIAVLTKSKKARDNVNQVPFNFIIVIMGCQ
jgi:hypothetical protein